MTVHAAPSRLDNRDKLSITGGHAVHRPSTAPLTSRISKAQSRLYSSLEKTSLESVVNIGEIMSWMSSFFVLGMFYNSVGALASDRGVDYTDVIATRYDYQIPVVPMMIIPYTFVYVLPYAHTAICLSKHGLHRSMARIRRFYLTQAMLMGSAYLLYILFPVSISSFGTEVPTESTGMLQRYTYNFVNKGMTTFCACPSMHVAHTLSVALIQHADKLPGSKVAMVAAFATLFSTVMTRAHFIMDVPFGIVFALLINHSIFRNLQGKLHPPPKGTASRWSLGRRAVALFTAPLALFSFFVYLEKATGSETDMLGMLTGRID
jgi:hypothetical protein